MSDNFGWDFLESLAHTPPEEITVRADGSIVTGPIKEGFRCCYCTMMLPPMRRSPEHPECCKSCEQEYF